MSLRRLINQTFSLAPMPIMLVGAVYSYFDPSPTCGMGSNTMTFMWLAMAFAHTSPWLFYFQAKNILPVKQQ